MKPEFEGMKLSFGGMKPRKGWMKRSCARTEELLGYATLCVFDRVIPPHPDPLPREREQQASDWCFADGY